MPSTTDVIQVATGVASLAVSALALREARLQRVARGGNGPPPPAPAPYLPADGATVLPPEPAPPAVALPPPAVLSPRPATDGPSAPASPGPARDGGAVTPGSPPGPAPREGGAVTPGPPWRGPGEGGSAAPLPLPAEGGVGAPPPARPGSGPPGYPPQDEGSHRWPGPAAARSRGWLPWVAVVGVAAVLLGLGGVALLLAGQDDPTSAAPGEPRERARQSWALVSMALLVLTVVLGLVVRGRRPPSRVAWVAVPAVLAAASVGAIVFVLPVPAAVKLGAVVAALGVAAWAAFRR